MIRWKVNINNQDKKYKIANYRVDLLKKGQAYFKIKKSQKVKLNKNIKKVSKMIVNTRHRQMIHNLLKRKWRYHNSYLTKMNVRGRE